MPLVHRTDHRPPFWLPNGHFQSIYPSLFRVIENTGYKRERINIEDSDFLDIDWSFSEKTSEEKRAPLVILSHGLEGSSSSQYIRGMVRQLTRNGYDCLSWNFRSCSGEMNRTSRFYHSGATEDLEIIVQHALAKGYKKIKMIGFSLGGNLTLKYLGESGQRLHPEIKASVVFSVPMNLRACSLEIIKTENRLYMHRFLRTLKKKIQEKSVKFPDIIRMDDYKHVRTLYDFDHIYTAAIHGYQSADDYYEKCSSMHFVENISIPTLIVNAKNDPMVPFTSLPTAEIARIEHVWLELTDQGGHCGFRPDQLSDGTYWSENRAIEFLQGQ